MTDKEILQSFNKSRKGMQEKEIIRPVFHLRKELFFLITGTMIWMTLVIAAVIFRAGFSSVQFAAIIATVTILFIVTQMKNALLLLIFLYQRFAPASVRRVCLFMPSCSEYMRLSVLKYGVWRGVWKGLCRLRRCHPPNGGIDEP